MTVTLHESRLSDIKSNFCTSRQFSWSVFQMKISEYTISIACIILSVILFNIAKSDFNVSFHPPCNADDNNKTCNNVKNIFYGLMNRNFIFVWTLFLFLFLLSDTFSKDTSIQTIKPNIIQSNFHFNLKNWIKRGENWISFWFTNSPFFIIPLKIFFNRIFCKFSKTKSYCILLYHQANRLNRDQLRIIRKIIIVNCRS